MKWHRDAISHLLVCQTEILMLATMGEDVDAAAGCLGRSGMSVATPSEVQVCRVPEQMSLEMFFTLMFMAVSAAAEAAEVVC